MYVYDYDIKPQNQFEFLTNITNEDILDKLSLWIEGVFWSKGWGFKFNDALIKVLRVLIDNGRNADVVVVIEAYVNYHRNSYSHRELRFSEGDIVRLLDSLPDHIIRKCFFDYILSIKSVDKSVLSYFVYSDESELIFLKELSKKGIFMKTRCRLLFDEKYVVKKELIKKLPPIAKLKCIERILSTACNSNALSEFSPDDIQDILFESSFHKKYQVRVSNAMSNLLLANIAKESEVNIESRFRCDVCGREFVKSDTTLLAISNRGVGIDVNNNNYAWKSYPSLNRIFKGYSRCGEISNTQCRGFYVLRLSTTVVGITSTLKNGWVLDRRIALG